jgi:peptide/nickel transport system substrate-binding protein
LVAAERPASLDPLLARDDPAAQAIGGLLYRRLLRLDDRVLPAPDLARQWGVSGDGLSYRFTLGTGLRWSDGSLLGIADVQATVALIQSPGFPDEMLAATWKGVTVAGGGGTTVVMTIPAPRASFAASVARLPILPATFVRGKTPADLLASRASPMPASGPYHVRSADATAVRLVPNPWSATQPDLRSIELRLIPTADSAIRAFAGGDVDAVLATTPAQRSAVARVDGARLHDMVSFRFVDLLLNARHPGLDDPIVRQAIAGAVDRRALVTSALGGDAVPQAGAIPAGIAWVGPVREQPNPALSARALDAAGWRSGPDGTRVRQGVSLAFGLVVPDAGPLPAVARKIREQLAAVGVAVTIRIVPATTFEQGVIIPAAFDVAIADWHTGPDPDVSAYWRSNATPPNGVYVSGVPPDPFLDQGLDALGTETDVGLRQAAAQSVEQRLAEDVPAVFLYAPEVTLAVSDAISGVRLPRAGEAADRYAYIASWQR